MLTLSATRHRWPKTSECLCSTPPLPPRCRPSTSPLGVGDNRQEVSLDMCLVLIDRLRDPSPGLQAVVTLHIGKHATLMRIARQERTQHRPELSTNLHKVPGNIDHRDAAAGHGSRHQHLSRDLLDLSLDQFQERVNLGRATCNRIASRLKPLLGRFRIIAILI